MEINYKKIGNRARTIRKQKRLSQEQIAKMVGVNTSHICHIENGATKMSVQVLVNLCNALSASTDELLCDHVYKAKGVLADEMAVFLADCSSSELQSLAEILKIIKIYMRKECLANCENGNIL